MPCGVRFLLLRSKNLCNSHAVLCKKEWNKGHGSVFESYIFITIVLGNKTNTYSIEQNTCAIYFFITTSPLFVLFLSIPVTVLRMQTRNSHATLYVCYNARTRNVYFSEAIVSIDVGFIMNHRLKNAQTRYIQSNANKKYLFFKIDPFISNIFGLCCWTNWQICTRNNDTICSYLLRGFTVYKDSAAHSFR